MSSKWHRGLWALFVLLWVFSLGIGLKLIADYKTTPGATGAAPEVFPDSSRLQLTSAPATVFMFVHPKCACSRASIAELSEVMREVGPRAQAQIVAVHPESPGDRWSDEALEQLAKGIAGTHVVDDFGGVEAQRFGALTSGHVLVYERQGKLAFSGGMTASRAHAGDNMGRRLVIASIVKSSSDSSEARKHDVFGCELEGKDGHR